MNRIARALEVWLAGRGDFSGELVGGRQPRRRILRTIGTAFTGAALTVLWSRQALAQGDLEASTINGECSASGCRASTASSGKVLAEQLIASAPAPPALTAEVRIYETTTTHNSFPDSCEMRLPRLYVAEDLGLAIEVHFNRELSDEESQQVQWSVTNDAAAPATGDFTGQPNPALVTTILTAGPRSSSDDATVSVTFQGDDIASPVPLRVIPNAEYTAAYATLASYTALSGGSLNQLPLTSDLLARFLGQDSTSAGTPTIGTYQLSICDARLTQRAGANWGQDTLADVPLVQYGSDQPASSIVAEGVAVALLSQNAQDIRDFFSLNPQEQTHEFDFTYSGNLTLDRPADANFALHGVDFDGTVSTTIDAPTGALARLTAHDVQVSGTVTDLYDFDIEATGRGAFPSTEAAKVQIASVKHDTGKVFVVSFSLDSSMESLNVDGGSPGG